MGQRHPRVLLGVRPLPLPPERTVIELLEGQAVDDELLAVLGELRAAGFRIALDDFRVDPGWERLVEHADAVKLDIRELPGAALGEAVERLRRPGLYLLAEKVETREEYEHCRALGFDAFQGYFFAQPLLVEGGTVPTHRLAGLATLAQAGDAASFEELERLISQDAGLAYKLVRLANSAYVGSRTSVASVHGALTLMGTINVRRWSMLLALAGFTDRPQHLLATGLLRARQCELLARCPVDSAVAFTVGLFSILPALVVDGLAFDQLDHRALGRQRQRAHLEQELARDVDPCLQLADQRVEPDVGERAHDHVGGRAVRPDRARSRRAVQQLVAADDLVAVEDRLAGDRDGHAGPSAPQGSGDRHGPVIGR